MQTSAFHLPTALAGLDRELEVWAEAGRRCRLWWRDDDAQTPTPEFRRLMALSGAYRTPLLVAVVPSERASSLADAFGPLAWAAQHGADHRNVHPVGRPNQFRPDATLEVIEARLLAVRDHLSALPRRLPIYVPPWNTLTPALPAALAALDLPVLSAFGRAFQRLGPVVRADTHLDILRWAPRARFHGVGYCLHRLTRRLKARRREGHWEQPIGLLSHHLVHDEHMWRFLEQFLAHTSERPGLIWERPDVLVAEARRLLFAPPPESGP